MRSFIRGALLFIMILTGCGKPLPSSPAPTAVPATETPPETVMPQGSDGYPWWNDTVFYEIFVRSFRDSDGDGIGDFNGVAEKLDYLQGLGVRGIWLMPIFPSPSYHGYDVTDYYAVNDEYGTIDDFKHLLEEAHKRGIRVIIDLVLNHTSAQHPWFQKSLENDPQYADWYVWSDTDPGGVGPWGQTVWHKAGNGKYYYAVFWDQMPDLNFNNPSVRQETQKITSFWLKDVGVDGFRLDGARYWVEDATLADSPANHEFLKEWGAFYRGINPQAFSVGEIWTENYTVSTYTKDNMEVDSAFNFDLAATIIKSLNEGNNSVLAFTFKTTVKLFPEQDNSNFITNHDMPRVANQLGQGNLDKAKAAAGILMTAPGMPFIYYGEEIGMSGAKPDELIRTPMQWTNAVGAGFSEGNPWEAVNSDYTAVNVAAQNGDPTSLLEHYRTLIQLRNEHPALRIGNTYVAESNSNKLVSYLRASKDETLLVMINIDDAPVSDYQLELGTGPLSGNYDALSLLDNSKHNPVPANDTGGFDAFTPLAEIPPYGVIIIQLIPQN